MAETELVSPRARASLERILQHAAQSRLARNAGDAVRLEPLPAWPQERRGHAVAADLVVLTISSMVFRLVLVLRVQHDTATRDYYVGDADRTLRETFVEYGNLCCGALNQALLDHYPDLGMSTPYVLSAHCAAHLDALAPAYQAMYAVTIAGTVSLQATLCVCANAPVDFMAEVSATTGITPGTADGQTGGELEFF